MSGGLTRQQLEKYEKDGILIIEDFLTKDEVSSIRIVCNHDKQIVSFYVRITILVNDSHVKQNNRDEIYQIVENLDPLTDRGVFSTTGCQQVSTGSKIIFHIKLEILN